MLHAADDEALARVPAGVGSADAAAREGRRQTPRIARARVARLARASLAHARVDASGASLPEKMSLSSMDGGEGSRERSAVGARPGAVRGALARARVRATRQGARAARNA